MTADARDARPYRVIEKPPAHLVGSRVPRDCGRAGRASLPGFAISSEGNEMAMAEEAGMKGWRERVADIFTKRGEIAAKMKSASGPLRFPASSTTRKSSSSTL